MLRSALVGIFALGFAVASTPAYANGIHKEEIEPKAGEEPPPLPEPAPAPMPLTERRPMLRLEAAAGVYDYTGDLDNLTDVGGGWEVVGPTPFSL